MNANRIFPRHAFYPGEDIGNYRIIDVLGRGGFAVVYLCKHRYLKTLAAVKVLRTRMNESDESNFYGEARIAASLIHPHIIRVLDFGLEDHKPYLVMDHASNGTLRQLYPLGSKMAPRTLVKYVRQAAAALQYVHDRGLVHRDIKPENLLLGKNNELLLSDFGICINTRKTAHRPETIAGTAAYMAPELIEGQACYASDQYALGVVVYEWLCGTWPFQGASDEIMDQHLYDFPPSLRERIPTIPAAVEKVVLKALAKNPGDRFDSVMEFATALSAALGYGPTTRATRASSSRNQPTFRELAPEQKPRQQNIWKRISALFAFDLFAASIVGMVSYVCGMASELLWVLLSLSLVLIALGGALAMRNRAIFLLTCCLSILAALPGIIFRSFALFALLYISLLLLSLPAAFATSIQND